MNRSTSEAVYGLGLIGAAVYFISHATTFWVGVLGFFKSPRLACSAGVQAV